VSDRVDFLVIGAGIAGASAAYELAAEASVIVLEMEDQPGFHATGRSAAFFTELYGNSVMRGLTSASRAFYETPPPDLFNEALLSPRGALYVARTDQIAALDAFFEEVRASGLVERGDGAFARARSSLLAPDYTAACLWEESAREIDAHALLHGYLKGARRRGATLRLSAKVHAMRRDGDVWRVEVGDETYEARTIVNAGGAWAANIGQLAAASPVPLTPKRRTACVLPKPEGASEISGAVVIDIDEEFYFKPDAGQVLLSPADETPTEACDAYPEDIDIAIAVDRFERATGLTVSRMGRSWAGLRTFTPDKTIVLGFDSKQPGFFWLAGQGGYGIQTAPAAARSAAALALGRSLPVEIQQFGVSADAMSPSRFVV
jgi:D-arginine dehydrogenase